MDPMPKADRSEKPSPKEGGNPLDILIEQALENRTFSGIACGVWVDGSPGFLRYEGTTDPLASADTSPKSRPVSAKTLFDAASLTKPLATALLVMKARESGSLDLDEALGHYLPEANPRTADIPIRELLTHTGGMPPIPFLESGFPSPEKLERSSAISNLLSIEPERKPGKKVSYSCTGYMLLGLLLERISGMLLGDLYRREIAETLGLPRASFAPGIGSGGEPLPLPNAAATEFCRWRGRRVLGRVHDESAYCLGGHAGNAGLFVSLEDVFLTASLFLHGGTAGGLRFLGEKTIADMSTEKTKGLGERRSFGFRLHDSETFEGPLWPESSFGHTGFTGTSVAVSPEGRMIAIILSNRVYYGRDETTRKMTDFRNVFHSLAFRDFLG